MRTVSFTSSTLGLASRIGKGSAPADFVCIRGLNAAKLPISIFCCICHKLLMRFQAGFSPQFAGLAPGIAAESSPIALLVISKLPLCHGQLPVAYATTFCHSPGADGGGGGPALKRAAGLVRRVRASVLHNLIAEIRSAFARKNYRLKFGVIELSSRMPTITDTLIVEHRILSELFSEVERCLPELTALGEVRLLARLIERLLEDHAGAEQDLAYRALDHLLFHEERLERMHQDHQEIDERLRQAQKVEKVDDARRKLNEAISFSREHFRREERQLFPLIENSFLPATLSALGSARIQPQIGPAIQRSA